MSVSYPELVQSMMMTFASHGLDGSVNTSDYYYGKAILNHYPKHTKLLLNT